MANQTSSIEFVADVSQFTKSLAQMNSDLKLINSEFEASASELDNWENETEGITLKINSLNEVLEKEKQKLENINNKRDEYQNVLEKNRKKLAELEDEYKQVIAAEGENSDSAKKLAKDIISIEKAISKNENSLRKEEIAMNKQQVNINKTKKSIDQYEDKLKELNGELKNNKKNTDDASNSTGKFSGSLKSIGKGSIAVIAGIGAAALTAAKAFLDLAESTREYRTEMAKLQTTSDSVNANFEETKEAFQDLVAVTNDEGAATEAISNLLSAGFKGDELDEINQYIQGAAIQWKDTLKAEGLADSLQEWIGSSGESLTGNFAELLERLGYNLDEIKSKTAGFTDEQRRAYAMDILRKEGMGEITDAYKEQNKDLYEASLSQQNLTNTLAELGAIAEPITTILRNDFAKVLEMIIPYVKDLSNAFKQLLSGDIESGIEGLSDLFFNLKDKLNEVFIGIFNGLTEAIPELLPKISEFLIELIGQIVEFTPLLLDAALQLLGAIVDALPPTIIAIVEELPQLLNNIVAALNEMIPTLLDAAIKFLMSIVEALPSIVTALVDALPQLIDTLIGFLIQNIPIVLEACIKLLMSLIDALPTVLTAIIEEMPRLITTITKTIAENLPKLFAMSIDLWLQLVKAIPKMIPDLLKGINDIVDSILDSFDTDMLFDVGKAIIEGLWDGIKSLKDWLQKKLESAADWLPGWVKDKLGIASPSKVFAEIGKYSADGIGVGFTDEMKKVKKSIVDAVNMDDLNMNGNVNINGNNSLKQSSPTKIVNLTQNNYSPKALSPSESYKYAKKMESRYKTILAVH